MSDGEKNLEGAFYWCKGLAASPPCPRASLSPGWLTPPSLRGNLYIQGTSCMDDSQPPRNPNTLNAPSPFVLWPISHLTAPQQTHLLSSVPAMGKAERIKAGPPGMLAQCFMLGLKHDCSGLWNQKEHQAKNHHWCLQGLLGQVLLCGRRVGQGLRSPTFRPPRSKCWLPLWGPYSDAGQSNKSFQPPVSSPGKQGNKKFFLSFLQTFFEICLVYGANV